MEINTLKEDREISNVEVQVFYMELNDYVFNKSTCAFRSTHTYMGTNYLTVDSTFLNLIR